MWGTTTTTTITLYAIASSNTGTIINYYHRYIRISTSMSFCIIVLWALLFDFDHCVALN